MLRRDRRRQRKRSAQAINGKRQGALCLTWAAIAMAGLAMIAKVLGASTIVPLLAFALALLVGVASLMYAHVLWGKERNMLGHAAPSTAVPSKQPAKGLHHRVEDTHRANTQQRGATRINRH